MSLYIRLERQHSDPLLFCMRELACTFGENPSGVFDFRNVMTPHFSICTYDQGYFLQRHLNGSLDSAGDIERSGPTPINSGDQLDFSDYAIKFLVTDPRSEVAARTQEPLNITGIKPDAWITYALASSNRRYPLWKEIPVSIGNSPKSMIQVLDLDVSDLLLYYAAENDEKIVLKSHKQNLNQQVPFDQKCSVTLPNNQRLTIEKS